MTASEKCKICQADFYPAALKDGKCPSCREAYPKARARADILPQAPRTDPAVMTEDRVREIVKEMTQVATAPEKNTGRGVK